jgi:hypothetical protein
VEYRIGIQRIASEKDKCRVGQRRDSEVIITVAIEITERRRPSAEARVHIRLHDFREHLDVVIGSVKIVVRGEG